LTIDEAPQISHRTGKPSSVDVEEFIVFRMNDQGNRAAEPMRVIVEKPETLNEANDVRKLETLPAPVHHFMLCFRPPIHSSAFCEYHRLHLPARAFLILRADMLTIPGHRPKYQCILRFHLSLEAPSSVMYARTP
jgi:hypothetical protein